MKRGALGSPFSVSREWRSWMLGLAFVFSDLTTGTASTESPAGNFSSALAELQEKQPRSGTVVSLPVVIEGNEAFLRRIDLAALKPGEIAAIVRLNAFALGDRAHALAGATLKRLAPLAAQSNEEGALAAVICAKLAVPAGIDGKERQAWRTRVLRHPGLASLLQSEFGDLALDTAMSAGGDGEDRDLILALAAKLDATKSTAAASAVVPYWSRRVEKLPQGERRESIRRQLVEFLTAALEKEKAGSGPVEQQTRIEESLTRLNGVAARGALVGGTAPEIHFIWSSREGWKSLSDLRGKVVVLDFWATWCSQCVAAFPEVARLKERYRGFDVEVVGVTSLQGTIFGLNGGKAIDCRGDPEKELRLLRDYIQTRAITWPIVVGEETVTNPDYGIEGLPTVVILAPDGTVRFKASGFSEPEAMARIDGLLTEFKRPVPAPVSNSQAGPIENTHRP